MARPVLSKRDFVDRFIAGEFGNRTRNWGTLAEYLASGFVGLTHVRNRVAGGRTWYNVPSPDVPAAWRAAAIIYGEDNLYLSEMGDEGRKVFQGEIMQRPWGLYLRYSLLPLPMREAFARQVSDTTGLRAKLLIERFMCQRSLEWLHHLLDEYDGHVVEFSTYGHEVGVVPGYNTMFWEVRMY